MSREVTLDQLVLEHPLWKNPRTVTALDHKSLLELGEDILERGLITNLIVQQIAEEDGSVLELVIDGQRRCMGLILAARAKRVAQNSIKVKVDDFTGTPNPITLTQESSDRMLLDVLAAAIRRAGLGSYEQCEAAVALHTRNPEKTMAEIGDAIGRSESWVSRMVRARKLASPKLVDAWAKTKVTDEQFKDLADINPWDKQQEALDELLDLRQGGREAKAEARNKLKEKVAKAKAEKKAAKPAKEKKPGKKAKADKADKKTNGANGHKPASDIMTKAKPALADIVELAKVKKPSDPYVKGLIDGARFAKGDLDVTEFAPAWRTYLKQVEKIEERSAN